MNFRHTSTAALQNKTMRFKISCNHEKEYQTKKFNQNDTVNIDMIHTRPVFYTLIYLKIKLQLRN